MLNSIYLTMFGLTFSKKNYLLKLQYFYSIPEKNSCCIIDAPTDAPSHHGLSSLPFGSIPSWRPIGLNGIIGHIWDVAKKCQSPMGILWVWTYSMEF